MGPPESQPKSIDWVRLPLHSLDETLSSSTSPPVSIRVSNADLSIPPGLEVRPAFVSHKECLDILAEADTLSSATVWEGFEQRRKVLRWSRGDPTLPACLEALTQRLEATTGHRPLHISIEEYPKTQLQKHFNTYQSNVTTFESPTLCSCNNDDDASCSCVVGILPIASSVMESINRPKRRSVDCWDLYSHQNHSSGLILDRRALYIKTKEFLWEWRSRIASALEPHLEQDDDRDAKVVGRYVLVKFSRLPAATESTTGTGTGSGSHNNDAEDSVFGFIPKREDLLLRNDEEMPPLKELLTVIVTTSPIPSNPSTELLERVFQTFSHGGKDFALQCRKVIVCDGCRERGDKVSKRHTTNKQAMRNGIVDSEQLENYTKFKAALRNLCASAPETSPFHTAEVKELQERQGYGFALRHALRECVQTPFVIVIQHDRTFMRSCPIYETVRAMWHHRNIKYVGMSMRTNLMYRDMFVGKYGRSYMEDMAACTLRPPEMALDASLFGPDSASFHSMDYAGQEKLRENILALTETYSASQQNLDYLEWRQTNPQPADTWQLSLTPTFFWYDNVHICETAHYRDFIFKPAYKMVVKGGFVEDKLSPVIKKTVERLGLRQGHARFGCFLLDDHSGMFFTGHLDGGNYRTKAQKEALANRRQTPSNGSSSDADHISD